MFRIYPQCDTVLVRLPEQAFLHTSLFSLIMTIAKRSAFCQCILSCKQTAAKIGHIIIVSTHCGYYFRYSKLSKKAAYYASIKICRETVYTYSGLISKRPRIWIGFGLAGLCLMGQFCLRFFRTHVLAF